MNKHASDAEHRELKRLDAKLRQARKPVAAILKHRAKIKQRIAKRKLRARKAQ
jgi:hypothetical protein